MQKKLILLILFCLLFVILMFYYVKNFNTTAYQDLEINSKNKYVLIAVNIDEKNNIFYFFYLPIAVVAWRKIGFEPIILLITTNDINLKSFNNNNPPATKTIDYLKEYNAKLILVKSDKNYDLLTAMLCRLFVGVLEFLEDDDYVISSDSDLIPIGRKYYAIEDMDAIKVWNAFCCGNYLLKNRSYQIYPMGHVGMKKKYWRDVIGLKSTTKINTKSVIDLLSDSYSPSLVRQNDQISRGDDTWNSDQIILSSKIANYLETNRMVKIIKKPHEGYRFDRSEKDLYLDDLIENRFDSITDFHAFHHDYLARWPISRKLFKKVFDDETYQNLNLYYVEFSNSIVNKV